MTMYVWLNIATGQFSNSWTSDDMARMGKENLIKPDHEHEWKLIEYQCISDKQFTFNKAMVLK